MTTVRVLLYGLEGSGKTTLVESYQQNEFTSGAPFTNQNIIDLTFKNTLYRIIEIGGRKEVENRVMEFIEDVEAIIYVVDGSNENSYQQSKQKLTKILNYPASGGKPVVVLFNKVDLTQNKPAEFVDRINLLNRFERPHQVFKITAKQPDDFQKALNWIHSTLREEQQLLQDKDTRLISMGILDLLNEKKLGLPLLAILGQLEIVARAGQIKYDRDKIITTLRKMQSKGEVQFNQDLHVWQITDAGKKRLLDPELVKGNKYEKLQEILKAGQTNSKNENEEKVLDEFELDELAELYDQNK